MSSTLCTQVGGCGNNNTVIYCNTYPMHCHQSECVCVYIYPCMCVHNHSETPYSRHCELSTLYTSTNRQSTIRCYNHPACVHYNSRNQDTSLIRTLSSVPRVSGILSGLERFSVSQSVLLSYVYTSESPLSSG